MPGAPAHTLNASDARGGVNVTEVPAVMIGVVAGQRMMLAPAVASWGVRRGALRVGGTRLAFLGKAPVAWTLTALALGELFLDQTTLLPHRTLPA